MNGGLRVIIDGPMGSGKTTLARLIAQAVKAYAPDTKIDARQQTVGGRYDNIVHDAQPTGTLAPTLHIAVSE